MLQLLCSLDALPFEAKVTFLEAAYAKQEVFLQEKLKRKCSPWKPKIPLVHQDITCDGCNKKPIQGLRFKCKSCPDYDLCAECFTRKGLFHSGEQAAHEFDMISFPCSSLPWLGSWKGKGKGKGKGKA